MSNKEKNNKKPKCGLCGKSKKLTKTSCCNNWICDDADKYVMFSYARNSCFRNHDRYTLCAYHDHENHKGNWDTCKKCLKDFDTEDYVWRGTNEFNYEKLTNPPKFKPTHCSECDIIIRRGEEGYTSLPSGEFLCETCGSIHLHEIAEERLSN